MRRDRKSDGRVYNRYHVARRAAAAKKCQVVVHSVGAHRKTLSAPATMGRAESMGLGDSQVASARGTGGTFAGESRARDVGTVRPIVRARRSVSSDRSGLRWPFLPEMAGEIQDMVAHRQRKTQDVGSCAIREYSGIIPLPKKTGPRGFTDAVPTPRRRQIAARDAACVIFYVPTASRRQEPLGPGVSSCFHVAGSTTGVSLRWSIPVF